MPVSNYSTLDAIEKSKKPWGRLEYRVKWKDKAEDLTWWDADDHEFENAQEAVEKFHRKYPTMPR